MITRRQFVGASATLAAQRLFAQSSSATKAYTFLDQMMDKYASGSTLRLAQSFVPTPQVRLGDIGYTYDNAVLLIALLARGESDDMTRAGVLGDSFVYAQAHNPTPDGRVGTAYHTNPFILGNGAPNVANAGVDCGNMAWMGMALAQLYHVSGNSSYLNAAVAIGDWLETNTADTRGEGGYTGGETGKGVKLTYKSTENDLDVYALFNMLATFTGDSTWTTRAESALSLVGAMWNASGGFFWIGTGNNGVTINEHPIPEDCQSWSYLALLNPAYAASINWASTNLAGANGIFSGVAFSNFDTSGVWFEGTGHMAAALAARNGSGDAGKVAAYLADIELAQAKAPHADGNGIVAASKALKTGDGDGDYFPALHVGATGWYCLAAQSFNPFQLPA